MGTNSYEEIRANFELSAEEEEVFRAIDWLNCPRHIAIIMDGNGRWAKSRGSMRTTGHRRGVDSVYEVVETCGKIPVEYVTFYAFSTENWSRSRSEVQSLMKLFSSSLKKYIGHLEKRGVRIRVIGDLSSMSGSLQAEFDEAANRTRENSKICMTLAMNYSGRQDLVGAVRKIIQRTQNSSLNPVEINEKLISESLQTSYLPDPELLIRTSGEERISNFLLWECAYSEFYFTPVLWPDFRKLHLFEAIREYQSRQRRFGGA